MRSSQKPGGLALVFTGQGAQYARMGLELLVYPVFHDIMSRANSIMEQLGAEWSLWGRSSPDIELCDDLSNGLCEIDVLEDVQRIQEPQMSQPICTILQVSHRIRSLRIEA